MTATGFPLPIDHPHQWVAYLTARCNYACDYCIQKPAMIPGQRRKPWGRYQELTGRQWVDALNAMPVRPEGTLILTGGEPSLHKEFAFIASHLDGYDLALTSNLTFDVDALAQAMRAQGKRFHSGFHTYHPKFASPERWVEQAERWRDSGVVDAPIFSFVQLHEFPHFRDDEHDANVLRAHELAHKRQLKVQQNEFRGTHMGSPYGRAGREEIECTSAWVNIDPEGNIHNCQFHLTERRNAFGNITAIEQCRPMPRMGTFFSCSDYGFCDPCHENSGHGAFRAKSGEVFGRTAIDPRVYLQAMEPSAIRAVARRYLLQNNLDEAQFALVAAIQQARRGGKDDHEAWADLGVIAYGQGKKLQSLNLLLRAIALGATDVATLTDAFAVAIEIGARDAAREGMLKFASPAVVSQAEAKADGQRVALAN